MQNFCIKLAASPFWYAAAVTADMAMFVAGTVIISTLFFRMRTQERKLSRLIVCAFLCLCDGIFQTLCAFGVIYAGSFSIHIETLLPFVCVFILFFSRKTAGRIYKPVVSVFIYNIVPVLSQTVKMFIPWINSDNTDNASSFGVDFLTDIVFFALFVLFCILYARKKGKEFAFDKIDLPLYVFIVITVSVFISTLMFIDRYIQDSQLNNVYFILLLNVPTFAFTLAYASRKTVGSRLAAESYKKILDDNIRYYEALEEKNEELRIFRHDFPKTIAPLLLCIENGNKDEAQHILKGFNETVQSTRPRYSTGNHRLDNVLETQAQKAAKLGITLNLKSGSVFPNYGIDPIDIYTIFPNALDNAVEACEKTRDKVITVESKIVGDTVYVSISNPYPEGSLVKTAEGFLTTKSAASLHGFGTKSIKKAVSKYGEDNIFFKTGGGVFTLAFSLRFDTDYESVPNPDKTDFT